VSLLLEALKKAERAKEEAQRRARAESGGEATAASAEPERKPVLTRDKLPDLATTPLEIMSDDLSPPPPPKPAARAEPLLEPLEPPPALKPAPRAAAPKPAAAKPAADEQAASRASAKKVFEAKFSEPNPRLPFYIAMGALGFFAVGTVGYFWYQLRPSPALVNLNPQRQAEGTAVANAGAPTSAPVAAPAAAPGAIPGLPPSGAKAAAPSAASASLTASCRSPAGAR
jgi:hypothetical protein